MTLFGYDGSDFTHVMNFDGLSFVTHKATEHAPDDVYRHYQFGPVMQAARDQGVPFLGAYVVPRTGVDAGQQAQTAIDFVREQAPWLFDHPGFFWQVDLEHWPYDATDASVGKALADELKARTGKPVVIYASNGQYGNSVPQGYRLWNANYNGSGSGDFHQQYQNSGGDNNPAWGEYSGQVPAILQYSSDSSFADGNPGDANAFRGSVQDFAAMLGSSAPVPPPAPAPAPGGSVSSELRILDGVNMDSHGWKMKLVWQRLLPDDLLSRMYITSALRPYRADDASTHGYHGAGTPGNNLPGDTGALDIAAPMTDQGQRDMRDAAKMLYDRFGDRFLEIIHTTPYNDDDGFYVKNGQKYPGGAIYGSEVPAHIDHIHTAAHEGELDRILSELPEKPVAAPPAPPVVVPPAPEPTPPPIPDPVPVPDVSQLTAAVLDLQNKVALLTSQLTELKEKLANIFKSL